ncbi:GIY-YIG nuclease family protein [Clostridium sp. CCUG 7971]|uniref:GIY-YIG nuclease family protein n=1 Tax=Clostridium sp. CCUG 7971 TaxID=2811414 RepID=UPI001ABB4935|nr:GIY-YIG nuclease family protein [Clostridium sp. CCUG 7971]MBO3443518.1 GIY-YIG nuclease family protein [Clostridium sp. CCUG 7971]
MKLKEKINQFPKTPGIYMMKDKNGDIIYVGKSKKLRDRIKSYFVNSANHSRKVIRMVKGIYDIEIITTDTELDALLLECEMIKKIRPIYNKLMKNHENYKYIKVHKNLEYPYIEVVKEIDEDSLYFGPYSMEKKIEEIKEILVEFYKIRSCKRLVKCVKYDLNQCLGPCRETISKEEYNKILDKVKDTLMGKNKDILKSLENKMQDEILKLNFEKASVISNKIDLLKSFLSKQNIINTMNKKERIFAWIKLKENKIKVYIIEYGILKSSKIVETKNFNLININDLITEMQEKDINPKEKQNLINKDDIDFINIIYSYIKNNEEINYIIL